MNTQEIEAWLLDPDNEGKTWPLEAGDEVERKVLQTWGGGRTQGGIGPSKVTPNVFIFSEASSGERHGYFDGWQDDGCFHYTGEGQKGDQRMVSGNASILRHEAEGRALRVFLGAGGSVQYVDEFQLDPDRPWYLTDAPETGGGPVRVVIVFRLRPKNIKPGPPSARLSAARGSGAVVVDVAIEEQWTEKTFVDPAREPHEAERREAKLVLALRDYLQARHHTVARKRILAPGEEKPLFTDLFDSTAQRLVEAKGVCTREAIRMAIGQLADYRRFVASDRRAILVPDEPRPDLLAFGKAEGVEFIWPVADGFVVFGDGGATDL